MLTIFNVSVIKNIKVKMILSLKQFYDFFVSSLLFNKHLIKKPCYYVNDCTERNFVRFILLIIHSSYEDNKIYSL